MSLLACKCLPAPLSNIVYLRPRFIPAPSLCFLRDRSIGEEKDVTASISVNHADLKDLREGFRVIGNFEDSGWKWRDLGICKHVESDAENKRVLSREMLCDP